MCPRLLLLLFFFVCPRIHSRFQPTLSSPPLPASQGSSSLWPSSSSSPPQWRSSDAAILRSSGTPTTSSSSSLLASSSTEPGNGFFFINIYYWNAVVVANRCHSSVQSTGALWGVNRQQIHRTTSPFVKTALRTGAAFLSVPSPSLRGDSLRFVFFNVKQQHSWPFFAVPPL